MARRICNSFYNRKVIEMQSDSSHEDDTRDKIEKHVRSRPNILITGTPGTGKTTTSELVAIATGLHHLEVGKLVKEKQLHDGFDDTYQSFMINEDKVIIVSWYECVLKSLEQLPITLILIFKYNLLLK